MTSLFYSGLLATRLLRKPIIFQHASKVLSQMDVTHGTQQRRGLKNDLRERGIDWNEPPKVSGLHPDKSGDLEPFDEPDKTRPLLYMQQILDEYDEAPPVVQQLLSLEFSTTKEIIRLAKDDMMRQVQVHQYDRESLEVKIAMMTVDIRFYQHAEYLHHIQYIAPRIVWLNTKIQKRRKLLRLLRVADYKKFEWLIEKLNIVVRPHPLKYIAIYRYDSLRRLVQMRCENVRTKRMATYKAELEAQKESFAKEKFETLEWIKKTQEKMGCKVTVDPSTGMIEPPVEPKITIWRRIFGEYLDK